METSQHHLAPLMAWSCSQTWTPHPAGFPGVIRHHWPFLLSQNMASWILCCHLSLLSLPCRLLPSLPSPWLVCVAHGPALSPLLLPASGSWVPSCAAPASSIFLCLLSSRPVDPDAAHVHSTLAPPTQNMRLPPILKKGPPTGPSP